jgi:hypothetical protein
MEEKIKNSTINRDYQVISNIKNAKICTALLHHLVKMVHLLGYFTFKKFTQDFIGRF